GKTNPTCSRRSRVRARSGRPDSSARPILTEPEVGVSSPARQCMSVDLPDPDGPMIAVNSAVANWTVTLRSARTAVSPEPYTLTRPAAATAVRAPSSNGLVDIPGKLGDRPRLP